RYKLVPAGSRAKASSAATATPHINYQSEKDGHYLPDPKEQPKSRLSGKPVFSEEIERVINEPAVGKNSFLDLDTGKLITPPIEISRDFGPEDSVGDWIGRFLGSKASEMQSWPATTGADVMAGAGHTSGPGEDKGLTMFDGLSLGLINWDEATPEGIVKTIEAAEEQIPRVTHEPMPFSFMRPGDELPKAFAFKTREGGIGILQITSFIDNSSGVTLRYKLVQQKSQNAANQSKRQRFVPQKGTALETSWSIMDQPSALNPHGWAIMTHMTLGGVVPARMPGKTEDFCRIKMTEGTDDQITLRIESVKEKTVLTIKLMRDQTAELLIDGQGYRVSYPSMYVAPKDPDTSKFALVIVTRAEANKPERQIVPPGSGINPNLQRTPGVPDSSSIETPAP
ncbi:MAG: Methicillin resistance mecR1 protein, partial [Verrucomicrobiales bacterium]|nr:Methicillin resistance mecR1 protein [Verrucomicrobiales bacterium]